MTDKPMGAIAAVEAMLKEWGKGVDLPAPNPDDARTESVEWQVLSEMEREALYHEREAHRIRSEIRARVDDANRRGWWDTKR